MDLQTYLALGAILASLTTWAIDKLALKLSKFTYRGVIVFSLVLLLAAGYLTVVKHDHVQNLAQKISQPVNASLSSQVGGTINNNGPTYNGPVTISTPSVPLRTKRVAPSSPPRAPAPTNYPPRAVVLLEGGSLNDVSCVRSNGPAPLVVAKREHGDNIRDVKNDLSSCDEIGAIPTNSDKRLAGMSASDLRAAVFTYTKVLRSLTPALSPSTSTPESNKNYDDAERIFEGRYKSQGLALRNELLNRLHQPITDEILSTSTFLYPSNKHLAGAAPLLGLANTLDDLANRLPT